MSLDYLSKYLQQGSSSDKLGLLQFGLGLVLLDILVRRH